MKHMLLALGMGLVFMGCRAGEAAPFTLRWTVDGSTTPATYHLVLVNNSAEAIPAGWDLYYGSQSGVARATDDAPVRVEQLAGSHHRLTHTGADAIAAGDSLAFDLHGRFIDMVSFYPQNPYIIIYGEPRKVALDFDPGSDIERDRLEANYPTGERVYGANERLLGGEATVLDIIPAMKSVTTTGGECRVAGGFTIDAPEALAGEKAILAAGLQGLGYCQGPVKVTLKLGYESDKAEAYRLSIRPEEIVIEGADAHGAFNGCQSLIAIMASHPEALPCGEITDYPDMGYRGVHFDIARNFTPAGKIYKLIDRLAANKLNVLHLHLVDDEGWRIEIPGLEELTEIGSVRRHTTDEADALYPMYGSGPDATLPGSGYISHQEYIDLLRYAAARHIDVVPEIDVPGHSRAAIKAMNARYRKHIATDRAEAERYLLADPDDRSEYCGPQHYTDNVLNIAMPSVYTFLDKVVAELAAMYAEAGVPLKVVHVGGDEVPRGTWEQSPIAQAFMKEHGMADIHELNNYFMRQVFDIVTSRGAQLAGWQDIAMMPDGVTVNPAFPGRATLSYCWNTLPWRGMDQVPYKLANAGYPVVLANVSNLYFDLAYTPNHQERGLRWGGYVNAVAPFNLVPYDLYRSLRDKADFTQADMATISKGKVALAPEGRANIKGLCAELWAETLKSYADAEYLLFPKMYGLAERAWNAEPAWQGDADEGRYLADLQRFYSRVAATELPRLAAEGVNFRVSPPGLKIVDGMLYANSPEPGAEIRYTTDGSTPTASSPLWSGPVACESHTVKARAFYCGHQSVTTEL